MSRTRPEDRFGGCSSARPVTGWRCCANSARSAQDRDIHNPGIVDVTDPSKYVNGSLGKKRNMMAQTLARHMVTCDCDLTDAIANELLSLKDGELEWLKAQDSDVVGALLAQKMKSK